MSLDEASINTRKLIHFPLNYADNRTPQKQRAAICYIPSLYSSTVFAELGVFLFLYTHIAYSSGRTSALR